MTNSNTPVPNKTQEYKSAISTRIAKVLATLILIAGAFCLIGAYINNNKGDYVQSTALLIYGISALVTSVLVFLIGNLSEDVHLLSFNLEYLNEQNSKYQQYILQHLQEVDNDHDAIKQGISTISGKM